MYLHDRIEKVINNWSHPIEIDFGWDSKWSSIKDSYSPCAELALVDYKNMVASQKKNFQMK